MELINCVYERTFRFQAAVVVHDLLVYFGRFSSWFCFLEVLDSLSDLFLTLTLAGPGACLPSSENRSSHRRSSPLPLFSPCKPQRLQVSLSPEASDMSRVFSTLHNCVLDSRFPREIVLDSHLLNGCMHSLTICSLRFCGIRISTSSSFAVGIHIDSLPSSTNVEAANSRTSSSIASKL